MFEAFPWPSVLRARVIEPCADPRIHGYSTEADLATHYGFADVLLLSLTGEIPRDDVRRAFDVAMCFLAPVAIHEACTHAAAIARLCGAPVRAMTEVAAVGLAERARYLLDECSDLWRWLEAGARGAPPAQHHAEDTAALDSLARLRRALPPGFAEEALSYPLQRLPALVIVLYHCGLRRPGIEVALTLAALGSAVAEALASPPLALREYPSDTPPFRYQGDQ